MLALVVMMTVDPTAAARKYAAQALSRMRTPALAVLNRVADLVVPPACVSCRQPMLTHNTLCPKCWLQLDFIRPPLCDRLGLPMAFGPEETVISARALADPPAFHRARAVASHTGLARDLAHRLKYGDQQHVVPLLARLMAQAGRELLRDSHMLVPIPLGRNRLWRRSFNQAAVLAQAVSRLCGVPHDPLLLERARETLSQVGLSREQRQDNVRGAFRLFAGRGDAVHQRHITIVDDVITTGATVDAAAQTLLRAGASRVDVLSVTLVTADSGWRPDYSVNG